MSGCLLDTNVLSELRKGSRADAGVREWFEEVADEDLNLSVLVLGEIRRGVERARVNDPAKADVLENWLTGLEEEFSDRILDIDAAIADCWGRVTAAQPTSTTDGLLAATALTHDLTLVTRNIRHVAHTGVRTLNPSKE